MADDREAVGCAESAVDGDGVSRRGFVQGGLSGLGLLWANWLQAAAAQPKATGKAKSVILIFNCGAPSHIDLWDMKPTAADNIRGEFQPISTNVAGIQICELMPHLASQADKLAIVRSVYQQHSSHNSGMYWSIAGRPYPIDSTTLNPGPTDLPSLGTLVGWLAQRDGYNRGVPPYVITPYPHCDSTVYLTPGQFGGCLGKQYDPFVLNSDPAARGFQVPNLQLAAGLTSDRLRLRSALLRDIDSERPWAAAAGANEIARQRERAYSLVASPEVARAFDLSQEPEAIREQYGRHSWGQSHLLARRLVEAGTRFVTTVNGRSIIWDTHLDNFGRMRTKLVPPMEQAFAALLEDLDQRGMLESTLVVWMGDFGRTPIINKQAGRDHWPQCYSMVLAGGGIQGGQFVGESDRIGAYPIARPVTPADIHATIFAALGYDSRTITYPSADGRPMALSEGEVIRELLG